MEGIEEGGGGWRGIEGDGKGWTEEGNGPCLSQQNINTKLKQTVTTQEQSQKFRNEPRYTVW